MINLMKIFGILLDFSSPVSLSVKYAILSLGFLVLLVNLILNGMQLYIVLVDYIPTVVDAVLAVKVGEPDLDMEDELARLFISDFIPYFFRSLSTWAIPLIFSVHLFWTGKWKDLWLKLQKIEREIKLPEKFYKDCRHRCYLSFCLLLLVLSPTKK